MTKETVGCRVPAEWADELREVALKAGRTLGDVAIEAIAHYLGKEAPSISSDLADLQQRMGRVEGILGKLRDESLTLGPPPCPHCRSIDTRGHGRAVGQKRRWRCYCCRRTFTRQVA